MRLFIRGLFLAAVLIGPLCGAALAQQPPAQHACAYANDNITGANTVDGYSVTGASAVYLEPVATGGQGSSAAIFFATPFVAIAPGNAHLYASDNGSSDIALFNINSSNCQLTLVADYPSGGSDTFAGLGLAISPNGKFLYASNSTVATITMLGINADGSLTSPLQTLSIPELLESMAITPDGKTLITTQDGGFQVMAYTINPATGELKFASGVHTDGVAAGLTIDSHSKFIYIGQGTNDFVDVQVIEIGAGAKLTYISNNEFDGAESGNCLLLSPNGKFLFVTNQLTATVTTLNVNSQAGTLSLNSVVADGSFFYDEPSQLATIPSGLLVFTGDFNTDGAPKLGILRASTSGTLTSLGKFPLAPNSAPTSVAAAAF
jgi:DNA-binding beta-propeller fold protein YncE